MQNPSSDKNINELQPDISALAEAVAKAVIAANQTQALEDAFVLRDQLRRLPDYLLTEVLNGVILQLVQKDPDLCRWFIVDIFLRDADPEGKADVAERINLLMADLRSQQ